MERRPRPLSVSTSGPWPAKARSTVSCLDWPSARPSRRPSSEVEDALVEADVVVVENLCSLPDEPPCRGGGRWGDQGPAGGVAPPRPSLAAPAVRRVSPTSRRPRLGPRHRQRPVADASSTPSGSPPPWCTTPSTSMPPKGIGTGRDGRSGSTPRRAWCCNRPGPFRGRTWRVASPWPRTWEPRSGCSGRPRTGSALNWTGWWPRPGVRACWGQTHSGQAGPWSMPTRRATSSSSGPPGRGSATPPSNRRCTADPSPSARTRWRRELGRIRLSVVRPRRRVRAGRLSRLARSRPARAQPCRGPSTLCAS